MLCVTTDPSVAFVFIYVAGVLVLALSFSPVVPLGAGGRDNLLYRSFIIRSIRYVYMYSRERTILLRPLQCTVGCHNGKDQNESKVFYRSPLTQRTSADSFPCLLLRDINCYWSDHISTTTTATLYCPACPLDTLLQSGRGMEREERREGPTSIN